MNSRAKGARGEREFRDWLIERGHAARRGQQFAGGHDSPDVVSDLDGTWHIEGKRVEALRLHDAIAQAVADAGPGKVPVVMHKANRREWLAILRGSDLLALVELAKLGLGASQHREGGGIQPASMTQTQAAGT